MKPERQAELRSAVTKYLQLGYSASIEVLDALQQSQRELEEALAKEGAAKRAAREVIKANGELWERQRKTREAAVALIGSPPRIWSHSMARASDIRLEAIKDVLAEIDRINSSPEPAVKPEEPKL